MLTLQEHIADLSRHISMVRENALTLAEALVKEGRHEFARVLLAKAHVHDASKWAGIEWEYLHRGDDVEVSHLKLAIAQHQRTNDHHPEYWGGLAHMPEICVAEMVCDWLARSQEFGTNLRDYISQTAYEKFGFRQAAPQSAWITDFVNKLLPNKFAKLEK